MKKLIVIIATVSQLSCIEAKQPNTVNVDDSGVVSTGACKLGSINYDLQESGYARKPATHEVSDVDPRQVKTKTLFKW